MKILSLTSSYPRFDGDGTAPFIRSISETLVRLGHSVTVISPYDEAIRPIATNGVRLIRFRYVPVRSWHQIGHARSLEGDTDLRQSAFFLIPFFLLFALIHLLQEIRRSKPDILYAHWVLPNGLPVAIVSKIFRIPMVISLHGSDMFIANRNGAFRTLARWIFNQSKLVTSCSPEMLEKARALGAPQNSFLLPYGVSPEQFTRLETTPLNIRLRYGWKKDQPVVFSIGRLVHKKGFDVLIRAAVQMKAAIPDVRIIIGGGGVLEQPLKEQIHALGVEDVVMLTGPILWHEVPQYLNEADIFVLPSIYDAKGNVDGLPNVLLEAMACGKAIISSNIGGAPLVIKDQENGILVDPGNAEEIGRTANFLLQHPELRETLGKAARETVETRLSWDHICQQLVSRIEAIRR